MIQLTLVRHAHAAPAAPGGSDHERPLSSRGRDDAPDVARRLLREGVRPALVLTSTAARARATARAFADALGAEVRESDALYGADPDALRRAALEAGVAEVLLVAHDPGLSEYATRLAGREVSMAPSTAVVFTWRGDDWAVIDTDAPEETTVIAPR
jgi:phosphohistidine phosphatase